MITLKGNGMMKIASFEYNIRDKSIEIYVSGCKAPHCEGCHNAELWDFSVGEEYKETLLSIQDTVKDYDSYIDKIVVMGGEPLDQSRGDLLELLRYLQEFKKEIWLYTRYSLKNAEDVYEYCEYIKCGEFDIHKLVEDNIQYGVKLASSNQKIFKRGKDY